MIRHRTNADNPRSYAKSTPFDLDGTLSNTDAVRFPNWIEVLRPYGVEVTRELYQEKLSGRVDREAVEDVLPDLSDEEMDELPKREELRARQRSSEIGPVPGLGGLIEAGRRRGLPLALVTDSNEEDAGEILQPLGFTAPLTPSSTRGPGKIASPPPCPMSGHLRARACRPRRSPSKTP